MILTYGLSIIQGASGHEPTVIFDGVYLTSIVLFPTKNTSPQKRTTLTKMTDQRKNLSKLRNQCILRSNAHLLNMFYYFLGSWSSRQRWQLFRWWISEEKARSADETTIIQENTQRSWRGWDSWYVLLRMLRAFF